MYDLILGKDIPCWYDLSWQAKGPMGIIFKLHRDFVNVMTGKIPRLYVDEFMEKFNFDSFDKPFEREFGFENVFKRLGEKNDFVSYIVKIPRIKEYVYETCPRCLELNRLDISTNQLDLFGEQPPCPVCKNKKKIKKKDDFDKYEYVLDWQRAYAISASMSILFWMTNYFALNDKTACKTPQLITVGTITERGMHGGSLYGEYGKKMHRYLSSFKPRTSIEEMSRAMFLAYQRMIGLSSYLRKYDFRSDIDYTNGWLNVSVPGDACGLHPAHHTLNMDKQTYGYEFSCQNVDTPVQQISLIAGLAALNDKARREIK
jgi:hypothetical protein